MTKLNQLTALTLLTAAVLIGPAAAQTAAPVTEPVPVSAPMGEVSEDTMDTTATETVELESTETSTAPGSTNMSTTMSTTAVSTTAAPAKLPESALAVRQILARLGLLSGPTPATTAVLTDVTIPASLQSRLPGATWTPAGGLMVNGVAVSSSAAVSTDGMAPVTPSSMEMTPDMSTSSMDMTTPVTTEPMVTPPKDTATPAPTDTSMTQPMVTEPAMTEPAVAEPTVTPPVDMTAPAPTTEAPAPTPASTPTTDAPATDTAELAEGDTILGALEADGRFGTFLELVEMADLQSAILGDDYTLLVPTDAAFEALDPAVLEAVRADAELAGYILGYHVVPGLHTPGSAPLTNVYSETLPADLKVSGEAISAGGSQAFAIDQVIIPADLQEQK